jgi:hypothetical protein
MAVSDSQERAGTALGFGGSCFTTSCTVSNVVRCLYCDRDRLAGGTRAAVEDTVDEKLVHEQCCHIPAPVPRAEHPVHERAGDPRTPRPHRPGEASGPPGGRTRGCTLDSAARVKPDTPPAWPVRGRPRKADGVHRPPQLCTPTVQTPARNPSAMRPWTPQSDGLQRDKVTRHGTEKKRPASARSCS